MDPITMAISGGASLISGLFGAGRARRAARRARRESAALERRISNVEANRQAVIDPYANIKDLSNMINNPFQNLQVATEAAEMRAREQDLSLATTLDTLRATGASAGGATALAQAALKSKQGIAADIAKQEAQNAMARAKGEQMATQQRLAERARVQALKGRGEEFKFRMQEQRDIAKLDRLAGQADQYAAAGARARQQSSSMLGSALGAVGGTLLSAGLSGGLGGAKQTFSQGVGSGFVPSASTFIPKQDNFTFFQNMMQNYGTKTGD